MKKTCLHCSLPFETYEKNAKYCSHECYFQHRWAGTECKKCGKTSKTVFCSKQCREDYWNKNDYHLRKKRKQWEEKIALVVELGGKCVCCGIADIRVLDINHLDRAKKTIPPHRFYTWQRRLKDWRENKGNLDLLCANCHRIHTWEQMGYGALNPEYSEMGEKRIEAVRLPLFNEASHGS